MTIFEKLYKEKEECSTRILKYELLAYSNAFRSNELIEKNKELNKSKKINDAHHKNIRSAQGLVYEKPLAGSNLENEIEQNALLAISYAHIAIDQNQIIKEIKARLSVLNKEIDYYIKTAISENPRVIRKAPTIPGKNLSVKNIYKQLAKTILKGLKEDIHASFKRRTDKKTG